MSDSAERRAKRKLLAEAYGHLPTREVLQAAADLERSKAQRKTQDAQISVQQASLTVAILSQLPRDNEENKPIFAEARSLLLGILKKEIARLEESEEDDEDVDQDEEA